MLRTLVIGYGNLDRGDQVELVVTGLLDDGSEFTTAADCILIVPPQAGNANVALRGAGTRGRMNDEGGRTKTDS